MEKDHRLLELMGEISPHFYYALFGFLSICALTLGVTVSEIHAPKTPFEPIRYCLQRTSPEAQCAAFFDSDIAPRYAPPALAMEIPE